MVLLEAAEMRVHADKAQDMPHLLDQGGFHGVQAATSLVSGWLLNFLEKGSVPVLFLHLQEMQDTLLFLI